MTPNRLGRLHFCAWQKLLLFGVSAFALLLFLLSGQSAQAQEPLLVPEAPGSISGVVIDAAGAPQANITVTLLQKSPYNGSSWDPVRFVETNATGGYRFGLLSAGIYRVGFSGPSNRFALTYYNGVTTVQEAQDVVIAGNDVGGINATLVAGAQITGAISVMNNIGPVGGYPPYIYRDIRAMRKLNGRWVSVKQMLLTDNPPDSYQLVGLPAGVYRVCVDQYYNLPPYQPLAECYNDIGTGIDNASDITLVPGETKPNINFVLGDNADLARITGTVQAEDGTPLANVNVTALFSQTSSYGGYWNSIKFTQTNAAGVYQFSRLQPGVYTVRFIDTREDYLSEVYNDAPIEFWGDDTYPKATSFPLQRYDVRANVNATLTRASHLVGTITLVDDGPLAGVVIQVYQQRNGQWQTIKGESINPYKRTFHIGGLVAGIYKVAAFAHGATSYTGYYGGTDLDTATSISLTTNTTRTNINIALTRTTSETLFPGEISGVVTTTTGPLKDIQVTVYRGDNCCTLAPQVVYVFTDANGRYRINGLINGSYFVRFSDPGGTYATIWNNNRRIPQFSQTMINVFGEVVPNVNASLVRGGGIKGNVRLRDGTPLLDIQVQLYEYRDGYYQSPVPGQELTTDVNGNYTITGLHPGVYQLCFVDPAGKYAQECYGASPRLSYPGGGRDLVVEAGKTLSGVDQVLGPKLSFYLPFIGR